MGAWQATLHRVAGCGRQGRTSLAFFSNQSIRMPLDGSAPENIIVEPFQGAAAGWDGVETHEVDDARSSLEWPKFFFERVAALSGQRPPLYCPKPKVGDDGPCARPAHGGA